MLLQPRRALAGVPKTRGLVLLLRCLGWLFLYFIPVHSTAIANMRGFVMHAMVPGDSVLVCNRTADPAPRRNDQPNISPL